MLRCGVCLQVGVLASLEHTQTHTHTGVQTRLTKLSITSEIHHHQTNDLDFLSSHFCLPDQPAGWWKMMSFSSHLKRLKESVIIHAAACRAVWSKVRVKWEKKNLIWKHLSSGTRLETGQDSASLLLSHHPYATLSSSTQTLSHFWLAKVRILIIMRFILNVWMPLTVICGNVRFQSGQLEGDPPTVSLWTNL